MTLRNHCTAINKKKTPTHEPANLLLVSFFQLLEIKQVSRAYQFQSMLILQEEDFLEEDEEVAVEEAMSIAMEEVAVAMSITIPVDVPDAMFIAIEEVAEAMFIAIEEVVEAMFIIIEVAELMTLLVVDIAMSIPLIDSILKEMFVGL